MEPLAPKLTTELSVKETYVVTYTRYCIYIVQSNILGGYLWILTFFSLYSATVPPEKHVNVQKHPPDPRHHPKATLCSSEMLRKAFLGFWLKTCILLVFSQPFILVSITVTELIFS